MPFTLTGNSRTQVMPQQHFYGEKKQSISNYVIFFM